jgi:putative restriction endonuclease
MLGVSADYRVAINREPLDEVGGADAPHGLQEMHVRALTLPARAGDRSDRERPAWRWERFTGA